jgi:hypothetical protein
MMEVVSSSETSVSISQTASSNVTERSCLETWEGHRLCLALLTPKPQWGPEFLTFRGLAPWHGISTWVPNIVCALRAEWHCMSCRKEWRKGSDRTYVVRQQEKKVRREDCERTDRLNLRLETGVHNSRPAYVFVQPAYICGRSFHAVTSTNIAINKLLNFNSIINKNK